MPITAADTTWRYAQTGDPAVVTLFFSEDLRRADNTVVLGPTEDIRVEVLPEEQAVIAAIIERGRTAFVAMKNASA